MSLAAPSGPLSQTRPPPEKIAPRHQVAQILEEIQTTPFDRSFLSRLQGEARGYTFSGLIAVDWETVTPWMSLMGDIRDHYELAQYGHLHSSLKLRLTSVHHGTSSPEREQPVVSPAPITYSTLQPCHLDQIHDLLERVFWTGIDGDYITLIVWFPLIPQPVSDSLEFSPEQCTVVACYKRLVVGVTIMSSPQETYITYLAVKAGWDKAQIARLARLGFLEL